MTEPRYLLEPVEPSRREMRINGEKLMVRLEPWDVDGIPVLPNTTFTHDGMQYVYCGLDESGAEVIVRVDDSPTTTLSPSQTDRGLESQNQPPPTSTEFEPSQADRGPWYQPTEADFVRVEQGLTQERVSDAQVLRDTYAENRVMVKAGDLVSFWTVPEAKYLEGWFWQATPFKNGRSFVLIDGPGFEQEKWAVLRRDGTRLTQDIFSWIDPDGYKKGQLRVRQGTDDFSIDIDGQQLPETEVGISPDRADSVLAELLADGRFTSVIKGPLEGFFRVDLKDGGCNFVSIDRTLLTADRFKAVWSFNCGRAVAQLSNNKYVVLKRDGTRLTSDEYDVADVRFIDGALGVRKGDDEYFIDIDGNRIGSADAQEDIQPATPEQSEATTEEEIAVPDAFTPLTERQKQWLTELITTQYNAEPLWQNYAEGRLPIYRSADLTWESVYNFVDPTGALISDNWFTGRMEEISPFSSSRNIVCDEQDQDRMIRRNGSPISLPWSVDIDTIDDQNGFRVKIYVEETDSYQYIDVDGNIIDPKEAAMTIAQWRDARFGLQKLFPRLTIAPFKDGLALAMTGEKMVAYLQRDGNTLTRGWFQAGKDFSQGRGLVNRGKGWFFINRIGNPISSQTYDEAESFKDGKAQVKQNGETFCIDLDGNRIEDPPTVPAAKESGES